MDPTYDFVIVGSGPSGSALASNLARSPKNPKVLLLEAGTDKTDQDLLVDGQRWQTFLNKDMNWGYQTAPQQHAHGRVIDYSRGKCLGGSTAINFGVYTVGARDDYDEWARRVGDEAFSWGRTQARLRALESFHYRDVRLPEGVDGAGGLSKYAAPREADHGSSGPLQVSYAAEWERDLPPMLDLFERAGVPLNPDHNSGNPLGMSAMVMSSYRGVRSTAKLLLASAPENLTIVTSSPVQRVVMEGKKAVGVESNGKKYLASKEVILCAGSLNNPHILMHSGIGPAEQLTKFHIPVIHDVPAIGQNLRDHAFTTLIYKRKEGSTDRAHFYGRPEAMQQALTQWRKDGTGPWAKFACEMGIAFLKLDGLASYPEFQALPAQERDFLRRETVPAYEVLTHFPVHWFAPPGLFPDGAPDALNYACFLVFYYNGQGRGEATLQSTDPDVPLLFDPKLLSSAFDRRVAIEALRETLRVTQGEAFARDTEAELLVPRSDSDEDLLEFWRQTVGSSWHPTTTVKMGRAGEADAVVDHEFRVMGVEGLRVADVSVVPFVPNGHTQSFAYVTGMLCAEKLVAEYGLA